MKERGKKVLSLIPIDLDGYFFSDRESGKKEDVLSRVVADCKTWKTDHDKFESELEKVIQALRSDPNAREKPPVPKL